MRGTRRAVPLIGGLVLAWTVTAGAQVPAPVQVIPLVGNVGADGETPWRTDVQVANLGVAPATVGLRFFPEGAPGSFDGTFPKTVPLGAGETKTLANVLSAYLPGQESRRGWLLVADATPIDCTAPERPYPALLAVSSRTYRAGSKHPGGAVQPNWLSVNPGQLPSVFVGGTAAGTAGAGRRWVGVANISTGRIKLRIRQFGAGGRVTGSADREVSPLSMGMWTLAQLKLAPVPDGGRLEVGLADDPTVNPCSMAKSPRPCSDPCDRAACPQRYRFPGAPVFFAFVAAADRASGAFEVIAPAIDLVGSLRYLNEYRQKHCPEDAGAESIVDLGAKLLFLRDPAALRKVAP